MLEDYLGFERVKTGHASIIIDFKGNKIQVLEANYKKCRIATRWEVINPRMRFYKPSDPVVAYFNAISFIRINNIK